MTLNSNYTLVRDREGPPPGTHPFWSGSSALARALDEVHVRTYDGDGDDDGDGEGECVSDGVGQAQTTPGL